MSGKAAADPSAHNQLDAHSQPHCCSTNGSVDGVLADSNDSPTTQFSNCTIEELRLLQADFAKERDWEQFHTPRNLLLALVGEVGELSECFQWKGETPVGLIGWSDQDKKHVGEEMADCLLYLIRLADRCGIDVANAAKEKIKANSKKYPASLCKGKSDKYTTYQQ